MIVVRVLSKIYTSGIKGLHDPPVYGVKLPYLQVVWAGQGWILPLVKLMHFFLGPWLLVRQFIEISNQMEVNGEVSNSSAFFQFPFRSITVRFN